MFVKLVLFCVALVVSADLNQNKIIGEIQEGIFGLEDSTLPEPHTHEISELLRDLSFEPQKIDFGALFVGQATTQTIVLLNQHTNRSVQVNSVSVTSPEFYSSYFETQEVPPQGNTSFGIVFLPRKLGAISSALHIHTSFGKAEITVRGEGCECPYRLKPMVGIKAPINATLAPEVYMYNPHEWPLQILEVYSSGGEFQLELPTGNQEGSQKLWRIPPYSAKPVIRVSFHGRTVGNHTAYIRIKIAEVSEDPLGASENILVIPVEFEILPQQTVYARNPVVDFGRLSTQNSETIRIQLDIQDHDDHSLIGRYLYQIPGLTFDENNTSVVLDPKVFDQSASIDECLSIHSKRKNETDMQEFTVLVHAEIFKGGLYYDKNVTIFATSAENLQIERTLVLRNDFEIPLAIHNSTLSEAVDLSQLEIIQLNPQVVLQPGQSLDFMQFRLLNESGVFNSTIQIATNVTTFELPLMACTGRLHVSTQEKLLHIKSNDDYNTELNLGAIPYADMSRNGFIILRNDNLFPIKITNWDFKSPQNVYFHTAFLGCLSAKTVAQLETQNETINSESTKFNFCSQLNEGDTAIFQLAIQTFVTEQSTGILKIWTPYEIITTSVKFRASIGQLDVVQDQLFFKNCYPGKICTSVISIRSTFMQPIHITAINFTQPGLRFKDFNAKGTKIAPQTFTKVGRIYFEPTAVCRDSCYINRVDRESDSSKLFGSIYEVDVGLLRRRAEQYQQMRQQLQSMSLTLHSRELPPLELDFAIDIEWPKLIENRRDPSQPAPTTEIGRVQRQSLVLKNPTQNGLLVDYFLADQREGPNSLPRDMIDNSFASCYLNDRVVFSLPNGAPKKPILIPAGSSLQVPIDFFETIPGKHCTLLHIRNNLTLYEAAWITARAVQSQFRFANRKPGSTTPLLFEFTDNQFEWCSHNAGETSKESVNPIVTVKRTFTARNSGELPIRVEGFFVGDQPCQGFGFRVNNCASFELKENATRKIEISFSPDYTTTRIVRPLVLKTNLSYDVSYILSAQMPSASIEACSWKLERPAWELWFCNIAIVALGVTFLLVLIAAFVDYREIMLHQSTLYAARYRGPVQPTFNLRNISAKIQRNQISTEKMEYSNVLRQPKFSQSNVKKRVNPAIAKKSKWTSWNMDMLMYKSDSKRTERAKPPQTTHEDNNVKIPASSNPKTNSSPTEAKTKKTSPTQPARQSKKPKQNCSSASEKMENANNEREHWKTTSQENVSSKEVISPKMATTIVTSKKDVMDDQQKVFKEQNGSSSSKKIGKTPGRERRKEPTPTPVTNAVNGVKKSEKKQRVKQLNFDASPTTLPTPDYTMQLNCITSPWETSSNVSFSQVLQPQNNINKSPSTSNNYNNNNLDWSERTAKEIPPTTQLGPIGSKKSPSSTLSMWETPSLPLLDQSLSNASVTQPSGSLFSNMDGISEHQLSGLSAELYEIELRRRQWEATEHMYLQHQQQQLFMQQQPYMQTRDTNNWTVNNSSSTWSPLAYGAPWQSASTTASNILRPPPGLESNFNNMRNVPIQARNSLVTSTSPAQNVDVTRNEPVAPQFDPFSSIWSDNWHQASSTSTQQRNSNNHLN